MSYTLISTSRGLLGPVGASGAGAAKLPPFRAVSSFGRTTIGSAAGISIAMAARRDLAIGLGDFRERRADVPSVVWDTRRFEYP